MGSTNINPLGDLAFGTNATNDPTKNFGSSGTWSDGNVFSDWLMHRDTQAHNDMIWSANFNAAEAEKARQFEKMMSDTQFQRKVHDYLKAGYSPLAALEGSGMYQVSSAPAASSSASGSRGGANGFGTLLGAVMMMVANVVTHGAAQAAANAGNAAKVALDTQKLDILKSQVDVQKGWLDLAQNGRRDVAGVAAQKALRKASKKQTSPDIDWDKLLDDIG